MTFAALVLAGSRGGRDPVADYAGVTDKALIEIGGETMLARVMHALRQAGAERIAVSATSGKVAEHARALGGDVLQGGAGPSESAASALQHIGAPLLVTTADHALLQPEWVRALIAATPAAADIGAMLARREAIEAKLPGTRRTYLRFAGAEWSGCNLFYCATPGAIRALQLWRSVEEDRKRPWRILRRLSPALLLRYAFRRLTLEDAIATLGGVAGVNAAAVETMDGLAAVDVDKPEDLDLVRAILGDARQPPASLRHQTGTSASPAAAIRAGGSADVAGGRTSS